MGILFFTLIKEVFIMNKQLSRSIKIALLAALAFALMYLEFPLPFMPPWLKLDISDVPALLGGFALGPLAGVIIEAIKVVLFFLFKNSGTGGIGELANFLIGISFVLPATWIYYKKKGIKLAVLGLIAGLIISSLAAGILNYYVLIPAYKAFMPIDVILDICKKINPAMNSVLMYVLLAAIPFTALKCLLESVIVLLLYKRLSTLLHKELKPNKKI